ncbi:hypothetical protein HYY75_02870 [bacterium]|nr:hypothetical protein [bacterium]
MIYPTALRNGKSETLLRTGVVFIEIMLGVLILAMTILPIFNFLSSTTGATKQEKAQAAAAAYAAKLMNQFLYELKWTNLTSGNMSGQGLTRGPSIRNSRLKG